ncbi:UNVERIFIED_ORG: hypothetical protein ABIC97_000645 [Peribacillus simplex]
MQHKELVRFNFLNKLNFLNLFFTKKQLDVNFIKKYFQYKKTRKVNRSTNKKVNGEPDNRWDKIEPLVSSEPVNKNEVNVFCKIL